MKAKNKTLVRVKTENVYSLWKCPDCGRSARWDFQDVQNGGTPVCTHCDRDMEFTGKVFLKTGKK